MSLQIPVEREKGKFSQSLLSAELIATKNMSKHKSYGRDLSTKITQLQGKITTHFDIYHIPLFNCKPVLMRRQNAQIWAYLQDFKDGKIIGYL